MFLVTLVGLFVYLSVSEQHYSKSYKKTAKEFYGRVQGGADELGLLRWVNEQKKKHN